MNLRQSFTGMLLGISLISGPIIGYSQTSPDADASVDPVTRSGLAAAVLSAEDLPTGYVFAGETFLTAEALATEGLPASDLTDAGFGTHYVSVYSNPESGTSIRSYVSSWTDASAAEAGFGLVEDEAIVAPDATMQDSDAAVGEEPRETTTGSYPGPNGGSIGTIDTTFRRDNLIAGVALETSDGSEPDAEMAGQLATRLDERVQSVQAGEAPEHTNLALPGQVISFASQGTVAQAGFLGPVEIESIYGVQGSVLDSVDASWVESTLTGEATLGSPSVTVGVTIFGSPEDATATVEQSADLFTPLANQEPVEDAALESAEALRAYRFSGATSEGDALDSYRLIFSMDATVTVVDVQGAVSDTNAGEAATTIATAQIDCQAGGSCDAPELPAEFTGEG